jgi:hypothetical protein
MSPAVSPSARRARARILPLLGVLLALLLSPFVSSPAFAAADSAQEAPDTTVAWSVRPADTVQGTGRPNFAYDLPAGADLNDAILVTNRSDNPLELQVYAADAFLSADGSLDILAAGEQSEALGAWIEVGSPDISVSPGETAQVPFSLDLPDNIEPGDYTAGIVASLRVESDGIVTERRLGSRIHVRVSGELAPALSIGGVSVDYAGTWNPFGTGSATLTYTLTNEGNARLAPGTTASVSGPFGLLPATVADPELPELLPGSSVERSVRIEGIVPLVFMSADVVAAPEVVVREGSTQAAPPTVADVRSSVVLWAVPWTTLVLLLLVAAAVVLWLRARRRRAATQKQAVDAAVAAALADRDAQSTAPQNPGRDTASPQPERVDAG